MLAILRRRWFMVAVSSAAFLIAIDYLSVGLGDRVVQWPLSLYSSLGLGLGWIVLAASVLIAQRRVTLHDPSGLILDYRRDSHFVKAIAVGVGMIALGTFAESTVLVTQFRSARYVLLGCIAAGYAVIAIAALALAKGIGEEQQSGPGRRTSQGSKLLGTCGIGIALGVLPYLFEMLPNDYRVDGVVPLETQAASAAVICGALLVAAVRKLAWPSTLAAVGFGFGGIAIGRAIEGVWVEGLVGYNRNFLILRLGEMLICSGYIAFGITAAIVAARTKWRTPSRLPGEGIRSPEVEGLWAR